MPPSRPPSHRHSPSSRRLAPLHFPALLFALACAVSIKYWDRSSHYQSLRHLAGWSLAQWLPLSSSLGRNLQQRAWDHWEESPSPLSPSSNEDTDDNVLEIPVVNIVLEHHNDPNVLLSEIEGSYGKDWKKRPLLLKKLWDPVELRNNRTNRTLSLDGLLHETMTVPYFTDARQVGALTPDDKAPVKDIVKRIVKENAPHKIATQFIVQAYPALIREVAPVHIVTKLFGNYFQPKSVQGTGPFQILPALTTVPLFVAWKKNQQKQQQPQPHPSQQRDDDDDSTKEREEPESKSQQSLPYTALHCEPIGNVAVQLSGKKEWTLVLPDQSYRIKPSAAPDGRAFFASWVSPSEFTTSSSNDDSISIVPTYNVVTEAGDALWVPTWTWHKVDYVGSDEIAIGASLFHFRPIDFAINNPLFAFLIIPALFKELIGSNTQ